ncbi:MAG: glucosaminidase domain-containing protein [gamma proteobacterium symbiont of Bathyaustriella thionipta]|nr:glucosaminidase domain-containing protein [gamma proteobacterium symbiont of Bathyaustriella thionipta]MCU7949075.1 glucosaminidase domain-containing protein [gamma proteobacterium symbiont of Bathyaustriella thionipta]MCU7952777.1 glucosaminidase domain-containing protein [gamma proteobacterium symbiont of Bathyaustriella thionipta]MCU7955726.1 glucosaminidase domain-containing protein [gamma proteobacterium symbiont of Bathyaustriella thionipta]MCU7967802.1 glucosaminidase domain-containin
MKYGTILLLVLSGIAQAFDYSSGYSDSGYRSSGYHNHYQGAYYPDNYYAGTSYQAQGYPVQNNTMQNQYASDAAINYQAPRYSAYQNSVSQYQVPQYHTPQYPEYQNQAYHPSYPAGYGYSNYYQPPYYQARMSTPDNTLKQVEVTSNKTTKHMSKPVLQNNSGYKAEHRQSAGLVNLTTNKLNQSARKKQFLKQILPLIVAANKRIKQDRNRLLPLLNNGMISISNKDKSWINNLAKKYRVAGDIIHDVELQHELVKRVDEISPSMALAQAANESAWGTSRFSKQGNNLFGIWTYNPDIGIKPLRREPGKKHFVRKFKSFQESVNIYMHTLNTHTAYKTLREIRSKARSDGKKLSGYELANGLEKYSAKGLEYIQMIQAMINQNNLENMALSELAINEVW